MSRLGLGALGGGPLEDRARRIVRTLAPAVLILLFQMIAFPIPAGVALRGVLVGLLTAMVSVGMALVYRANRILNFAQADLGYIPASLSVMIVITSGLPWLVAFGAGFAVAVALGAACELLIIRRFFRAPRLVLTVATLGLTQLLAVRRSVPPPSLRGEGAVAAHRPAVRLHLRASTRWSSTPTTSSC